MLFINSLLVNWTNGAIIMTVVFGLVIVGLIGAVYAMANSKKEKKIRP